MRASDRRSRALNAFLACVAVAGCVPLVVLSVAGAPGMLDAPAAFWLLVAFVIAGELLPIKVPGHDDEVTTSTPFIYALLLTSGLEAAALAQAFACLIADARRGRPLSAAFNVGQFTLALLAAGLVLDALVGLPDAPLQTVLAPADLLGLVASGVVFFAVNNVLAGTAAAIAAGAPVRAFLRADLGFQSSMSAIAFGFAPIVVAVADHGAFLMPLLVLPLLTLHRGSRAARMNEHHAMHDALTGLPNRKLFRLRAEQAIDLARRQNRSAAVLVMDLDRFKEINDTLGHHHGDVLLQAIGPRLAEVLRTGDLVARFGGDEFAVLLPSVQNELQAEDVARRLLSALERPFTIDGITLDVGASIGIVCAPQHGNDVDTLLQHGDVAMYIAKAGHVGWALYAPERDRYSVDRLALAGQLRLALERDELVLHYQPQIDLASGRVRGVEALVRWQHPERGLLAPDAFIPLAEHTGLIRTVTLHLLGKAIAQCAEWREAGLDLTMSVNASSRDVLDQGLVREVEELLAVHQVPARSLEIEITESTLMVDPRRAQQVLERLSASGVRIAVDDFGTGYSSLAYLKRLPIDHIKIDKSFVINMAADRNDAAIVASTIDLGRNLGLSTIAEGVEDERTYDELRRLGCEIAQGFWISRPVAAPELAAWVAERDGGRRHLRAA